MLFAPASLTENHLTAFLYLHGFNSSPGSDKARQTEAWLADTHPGIAFVCPFLSPFPGQAMARAEAAIAGRDVVGMLGSSMGGFYATFLAEKYDCRAVLVNPAVRPWEGRDYLLGDQANYHTGEIHHIEQSHLDQLRALDVPVLSQPGRFLVLVQTGDEMLDYRQAVVKYGGARVVVEEGGDHGFQGYQQHLPGIYRFLTGTDD